MRLLVYGAMPQMSATCHWRVHGITRKNLSPSIFWGKPSKSPQSNAISSSILDSKWDVRNANTIVSLLPHDYFDVGLRLPPAIRTKKSIVVSSLEKIATANANVLIPHEVVDVELALVVLRWFGWFEVRRQRYFL